MVVRVNAQGELKNSRPCIMCIYMMAIYGIYRVYYSDDAGQIRCEKISQITPDHYSDGLILSLKNDPVSYSLKIPVPPDIKRVLLRKND